MERHHSCSGCLTRFSLQMFNLCLMQVFKSHSPAQCSPPFEYKHHHTSTLVVERPAASSAVPGSAACAAARSRRPRAWRSPASPRPMRDSGGVPAGANWAVLALMVSSAARAAALSAAACFFAAFPLGFLASAWGGGSAQKNDAPW